MEFRKLTARQLKDFSQILDKSYRRSQKLFQIEGIKTVEEMLESRADVSWIACTDEFMSGGHPLVGRVKQSYADKVWQVSRRDMKKLTDTETPQGIVAAVKQPPVGLKEILAGDGAVVLVDGLSDPGNLGTIIRTADWFGAAGVIVSPDSVEVYNPKVVRSSMGSIFRIKVLAESLPPVIGECRKAGRIVAGASVKGKAGVVPNRSALVIGSEARGISPAIETMCDSLVAIPGAGRSESLNAAVACGILLYEMARPS